MEEEGEPKDPVVEAALDQGLGTRTRGLGGLLSDFSTLEDADPDDEQDYDCDIDIYIYMRVRQDCVSGGRSVRTRLSASLAIGSEPPSCRTSAVCYCKSDPGPSSRTVSSDTGNHPELRTW